jgi:hypothetical protein
MSPRRTLARIAALHLSIVVLLLGACTGGDTARVEAWENGAYQPRALDSYDITGRRDGGTTTAVATFTLAGGDRIEVEFAITYDPTPALGAGRWRLAGDRPASGDVRAESVKFLGGQGEGPSLGGRFRLDQDGHPRFRVVLPVRPVQQSPWSNR